MKVSNLIDGSLIEATATNLISGAGGLLNVTQNFHLNLVRQPSYKKREILNETITQVPRRDTIHQPITQTRQVDTIHQPIMYKQFETVRGPTTISTMTATQSPIIQTYSPETSPIRSETSPIRSEMMSIPIIKSTIITEKGTRKFTAAEVQYLVDTFNSGIHFPDQDITAKIAKELGKSQRSIQTWFGQRRSKTEARSRYNDLQLYNHHQLHSAMRPIESQEREVAPILASLVSVSQSRHQQHLHGHPKSASALDQIKEDTLISPVPHSAGHIRSRSFPFPPPPQTQQYRGGPLTNNTARKSVDLTLYRQHTLPASNNRPSTPFHPYMKPTAVNTHSRLPLVQLAKINTKMVQSRPSSSSSATLNQSKHVLVVPNVNLISPPQSATSSLCTPSVVSDTILPSTNVTNAMKLNYILN